MGEPPSSPRAESLELHGKSVELDHAPVELGRNSVEWKKSDSVETFLGLVQTAKIAVFLFLLYVLAHTVMALLSSDDSCYNSFCPIHYGIRSWRGHNNNRYNGYNTGTDSGSTAG